MKSNETIDEIMQKYIAGESTLQIAKTIASLDRIDSSKGYVENNIQWVHKDINKLKSDFDQNKFKELCILVANESEKIING